MEIKFSNQGEHSYAYVKAIITDDEGEGKPMQMATFEIEVPYDDSMKIVTERAKQRLIEFLELSLQNLKDF